MLDRRAFIAAAAAVPAAMLAGTPARAATLDDSLKSSLKGL
ncbi:MAG: twin-arginine translocation signal domain-containing protein [Alphaproteobacteria bacterium]